MASSKSVSVSGSLSGSLSGSAVSPQNTFLGFTVSWFQGFGFHGFGVSGFHPNRYRDRDRYRDRLFHHGTLSWVSRFHGFRVSGFMVSGFLGFIQIGVGVGIAIGIDCLTTEHFLGFQGFMVSRFQDFIGVGIAIAIGIDHLTTAS
ncbi:MAG TPA: hypothetical protein PL016_01735, partial [Kiritimatiellia bacterium]|nr:hypothetical protein [Kiritimatiellia bacterium]